MNAAFLLVTSAWLAGQAAPPPTPAKPLPPPAYTAPAPVAGSGCCNTGGCDTCGESCCGGGFLARLRACFHRHEDCCDTCGAAYSHAAAPAPAAACGCEEEHCCGGGLLARLRGWFHRGECCEEAASDCCGTVGAPHAVGGVAVPPRPPEPIKAPKSSEPPKEMPKGTTSGAGILGPQPVVTPATTLILER